MRGDRWKEEDSAEWWACCTPACRSWTWMRSPTRGHGRGAGRWRRSSGRRWSASWRAARACGRASSSRRACRSRPGGNSGCRAVSPTRQSGTRSARCRSTNCAQCSTPSSTPPPRPAPAPGRRRALEPVELPLSVVALDGKVTALPCLNQPFVQTRHPEVGSPYGLVRTMTAALVSGRGRPCIDAIPIPAETNEVGHFQVAFKSLIETYGSLFDVVSYDAGGFSRANADAVVAAGKDYLFALKDEHRTMCRLAEELLASEPVLDRTEDVLDAATTVVRSIRLLRADPSWSYGDGKGPGESIWPHAGTFLLVEYVKVRHGIVVDRYDRMYVSSIDPKRLTTAQWLLLVRSHWGVENQNHHTLDTAFSEDDRPWIEADANGMLAVLLLRRIAYTMLALFRSVTLRSEESHGMRWKDLLVWVRDALVAAAPQHAMNLHLPDVSPAVL